MDRADGTSVRNEQDPVAGMRAAIARTAPTTRSLNCSYVSPSSQPAPPSVQRRKALGNAPRPPPGSGRTTSPRRPRAGPRSLSREAEGLGDDRGSLARPLEIARVDGVQLGGRERSASARACSRPRSFRGGPRALTTAGRGSSRSLRGVQAGSWSRRYATRPWISASATGSASSPGRPAGIGLGAARVLADEGARVVVTGREPNGRVGARGSAPTLGVVCRPHRPRGARAALVETVRIAVGGSSVSSTTWASRTKRASRSSPTRSGTRCGSST